MSVEDFPCPQCGKIVSETDRYCKHCGASLVRLPPTLPPVPPPPPEQVMPPPYERRFSLVGRFYRLLTTPSEAMRDIALAPDYKGYFAIVALEFVLLVIAMAMVMQKIQITGTYAGQISGMLSVILAAAIVIAVIPIIIRWLVKSFIVKYAGDSGSNWSFKTAASVTGYAYIADVIFSILGIALSWLIVPTFHVDTTNLNIAIQQMGNYRAQINTLRFTFTLPMSFLGLTWKSYLGGLGTHFGTNGWCSKLKGFIVFFVLGLIGLVISFLISP